MPVNMFPGALAAPPSAVLADPGSVERSHRRCRTEYGLTPDLMRPILRLQRGELAPRSQAFSSRIGPGMRDIAALARVIARTGGLLVVSDAEHVVLSLPETDPFPGEFVRNGIAPGSCWHERIAGTNGIQMALDLGRGVTVRGKDHFYTSLQAFSCTAAPVLDEEGAILGTLTVASIDDGRIETPTRFHHLLQATAKLMQEAMFRRCHADRIVLALHPLVSTARAGTSNALIAVDDRGRIAGATEAAARLLHLHAASQLVSLPVSAALNLDSEAILRSGSSDSLLIEPDGPGFVMNVSRPAHDGYGRPRIGGHVPQPATGAAAAGRIDAVVAEISTCLERGIPVVLDGESGTGKSTIVRHLQATARWRDGAFLVLDCETLDDSTAFLHRVWGFLDAPVTREDGGKVIVLENLDLCPPAIQGTVAGFLRELEEAGRFRALRKPGVAPVQTVSCLSRDIARAIEAGALRRDLLFLLQGEKITLPPLRDDPVLHDTLLDIAQDIAGRPVGIDAAAMEVLGSHAFPGNLREARGILHHALSMSGEARIGLAHLPRYLLAAPVGPATPRAPARRGPPEAAVLAGALAAADWNVSLAARRLGISRATIHRRMREHGLTRPSRDDDVVSRSRERS